MKNKNILIFSTAYLPFQGGAELAIKEVTDRIDDYAFFLVTARMRWSLPRVERIGNVEVHRVGVGAGFLDKLLSPGFALWWALRMSARHEIVCFWSVMVSYTSLAPFLLSAFRLHRGIPTLLTLQEGDSRDRIQKGRLGLIKHSWHLALGYASKVHAISAYLAGLAIAFDYQGHIEIIPNGVDIQKFKMQKSKVKMNEKPTIVTTSRLVHKNGIDILIRAMQEVVKSMPEARLVIVGEGRERKHLEKLTEELRLKKHVNFVGEVPHEAIPSYLHAADIFVRPSRSEGLGISFLEAMAAGLPIIATPVGGIEDFLHDGETGLYAHVENPQHLAEQILRLFTDGRLRHHLCLNGRKLVEEKFSWDNVADRMRGLFEVTAGDK